MKHTYIVTGMICNGCQASVGKTIRAMHGTLEVLANSKKDGVTAEMSQRIPKEALQNPVTIGVTKTLLDKKTVQYVNLGTVLKQPMATFTENGIMVAMAAFVPIKPYA